jgi:hypothetical protein
MSLSIDMAAELTATNLERHNNSAFSQTRLERQAVATQSTIDLSVLSKATSIDDLPLIHADKKCFILESWLHKKRVRNSWIYRYGKLLVEIVDGIEKDIWWHCNHCGQRHIDQLYKIQYTGNAMKHLEKKHGIDEKSTIDQGGFPLLD